MYGGKDTHRVCVFPYLWLETQKQFNRYPILIVLKYILFSCYVSLIFEGPLTQFQKIVMSTSVLWPPDVKNWLTGKDPDAGKDWRQEEKGMTEDEMVGRHHQLDGHDFKQALGVGDGQGSLVCCSPWGYKELEMTEWLSWTELTTSTTWEVCRAVFILLTAII